jgi:glycosyltransferase involved in cell wall biosynthesis
VKIGVVTQYLDLAGGFGTYARELVGALGLRFPDSEFIVYVPQPASAGNWPPNVTVKVVAADYRRSRLLWWKHVTVPRTCIRDRVDLVHYVDPAASFWPTRLPVVMSLLDAIPWALPEYRLDRYQDLTLRAGIRAVDHIITISAHARQEIMRLMDVPPEKISVTYLGCSVPAPTKRTQASQPPFWLVFGGTERRKNVEAVIRALVSTDGKALEGTRVKVVGPITASRVHRSQAELLHGIPDAVGRRVDWLGTVDDVVLDELFTGAVALVFPSRYEGFGLPVLEAMSRGVPVIAAGTTSIPEVARESAILVDPQEPDHFARAMVRVLGEAGLAESMSRRGLETASEFSWDRTAEATMSVYLSVLERSAERKRQGRFTGAFRSLYRRRRYP